MSHTESPTSDQIAGKVTRSQKRYPEARARRRLAAQAARVIAGEVEGIYGEPTKDTDAGEVLLNEIRRSAGIVEWLMQQIRFSDPEAFVKSLWLTKRQSGYINAKEFDTADWSKAGALWVELCINERKHLASLCRTALAAGIEERRISLAERQAERVGEAIKGILYDLGELYGIEIDLDDDRVRSVIFRWLMQSSGVPTGSNLPLAIEA